MIEMAWTLGGRPELEHLRLRPWAHMLGFRGHFSTKSRRFSTTLGHLRTARPRCRIRQLAIPDDETVLVTGHWTYAGRGHSPGESVFAATIAHDLAENRRIVRQLSREDEP